MDKDTYKIVEGKNFGWIINIITFILFISVCGFGSFEIFNIQIYYQRKANLIFSHIVLEIIIILYISIFVHELGHLIISRKYGYNLKFFCVGPFFIIKDKEKLKFKIKITSFLLGGAAGIDIQSSIEDEKDFIRLKKDFKKFLIGGCIFNGLFAMLGILLMFNNVTIDIGFIIVFINILSITGCIFPLGDIEKMDIEKMISLNKNTEHIFLFMQNDLLINYEVNDFYREKIVDFVNKMLSEGRYNYDVLTCMLSLIEYNIIHDKLQPQEFDSFLYWLTYNHETLEFQHKFLIRHKINNIITKIIEKFIRRIKEPLNNLYMELEGYRKNKNILESKKAFQRKITYIKGKNI
ncbi:MAG: peptidase family [Clostridiaceae bacterium]|nr:peptidase family [Clostridiaceae bacterium]